MLKSFAQPGFAQPAFPQEREMRPLSRAVGNLRVIGAPLPSTPGAAAPPVTDAGDPAVDGQALSIPGVVPAAAVEGERSQAVAARALEPVPLPSRPSVQGRGDVATTGNEPTPVSGTQPTPVK
jgi:hypothetical protein